MPKDVIDQVHVLYICTHSDSGRTFVWRDGTPIYKDWNSDNNSDYDPDINPDHHLSNDDDHTAGVNKEHRYEDEIATK